MEKGFYRDDYLGWKRYQSQDNPTRYFATKNFDKYGEQKVTGSSLWDLEFKIRTREENLFKK